MKSFNSKVLKYRSEILEKVRKNGTADTMEEMIRFLVERDKENEFNEKLMALVHILYPEI